MVDSNWRMLCWTWSNSWVMKYRKHYPDRSLSGHGEWFSQVFQRSFVRCWICECFELWHSLYEQKWCFGPVVPGMKKVSIGSSLDSHVKCVEDPGNVHCDHTAKQLGRTGHLSDYFEIILATVGFDNSNTTELLSMNWTWNTIPNIYNKIAKSQGSTESRPDVC